MTDIDIDFANRDEFLELVHHIPASTVQNGKLTKHVVGVYFQEIPVDPLCGISSIPTDSSIERGWFKIDLLNNYTYHGVRDEEHLNSLLAQEPVWELLNEQEFVEQLPHIHGHHYLLRVMKPRSIYELAVSLALIRPAKKYLVGKPMEVIEKEVWLPGEGYYFKKAHAIAYAHSIVVAMNLIVEKAMAPQEQD